LSHIRARAHLTVSFLSSMPRSPSISTLFPYTTLFRSLLLYDHLGGRSILPGTRVLDLRRDPAGGPLKTDYRKGFEYSDCWVEDRSEEHTLNSSHRTISYAVFCLKKKKNKKKHNDHIKI